MLNRRNTLDSFIEMFLRVQQLDNTRSSPAEKTRANSILIDREKALGITSDELGKLLELIDEYETDEIVYTRLLEYYESVA